MFVPPPLPIPLVSGIIRIGIGAIVIAMIIRFLASWIRIDESNSFIRMLARITDPFIEPVRRIVGRAGIFDLSFLVTFFLLITIETLLLQALPAGW